MSNADSSQSIPILRIRRVAVVDGDHRESATVFPPAIGKDEQVIIQVMHETDELDVAVSVPESLSSVNNVWNSLRFEAVDTRTGNSVPMEIDHVESVPSENGREVFTSIRFIDRYGRRRQEVAELVRTSVDRAFTLDQLGPHIVDPVDDEDMVIDQMIDQLGFARHGLFDVTAVYNSIENDLRSNAIRIEVQGPAPKLSLPNLPWYCCGSMIALGSILCPPLTAWIVWRKRIFSPERRHRFLSLMVVASLVWAYLIYSFFSRSSERIPNSETTTSTAVETLM